MIDTQKEENAMGNLKLFLAACRWEDMSWARFPKHDDNGKCAFFLFKKGAFEGACIVLLPDVSVRHPWKHAVIEGVDYSCPNHPGYSA